MHLDVTAEVIDQAIRNQSDPIIDAIRTAVPSARKISVDVQRIAWTDDGGRHAYATPQPAARCIVAYDMGLTEPCAFDLTEEG